MTLSLGGLADCLRYSSILGVPPALAAALAAKVAASSKDLLLLRIGVTVGLELDPPATTLADALLANPKKSLRVSEPDCVVVELFI